MTPPSITQRQRECLQSIERHIAQHGRPPSLRELGTLLGVTSTNAVSILLRTLERDGYIRVDPKVARGIVVLGERPAAFQVPRLRALWYVEGLESLPLWPEARDHLRSLRAMLESPGTVGTGMPCAAESTR